MNYVRASLYKVSRWLFILGAKGLFYRSLSFKMYRWSLPREFKHISVSGPKFSLSEHNNKEAGKNIFWEENKIASTRPLKEVIASQSGSCFIVGSGPSIKDVDFSLLDGQILFGVNGSIEIFKKHRLTPDYYAITDVNFFENRFDLVKDVIETKARCFFSYGGLARVCEYEKSLFDFDNLYLTEIVNREYSNPRLKKNEFKRVLQNNKKLISGVAVRDEENVVGFSKDIGSGIFCSRTILYRAIQIAYSIGFKKIYLLGLDLDYKGEPRFYHEGKTVQPTKLDKDYEPYIKPSFEVLGKLVKEGLLEVYNLSDKSRLPESILTRQKLKDVIGKIK